MADDIFTMRFNEAITKKDIKAIELAEASGISKARISQYMNGVYVPKSKGIHALAKALDVDERWLMGFDVPMEREAEDNSSSLNTPADKDIKFALFNGSEGITNEMYDEVKQFALMVKLREEQKRKEKK